MTRRPRWTYWCGWFACLAAVSVTMLVLRDRLDKAHFALAFLLVVLGGSAAGGRTLGISLAGCAFVIFDFAFLPPYYTLVVANPLDWLVLGAFLVTSLVAAELLARATATAEAATQRAAEVDRLATVGAEALSLPRPADALGAILDVMRRTIGAASCSVFARTGNGALVSLARSPAGTSPNDAQGAVPGDGSLLAWVFSAGRGAVERPDGTIHLVSSATEAVRNGSAARTNATFGGNGVTSARSTDEEPQAGTMRALAIALSVRGETVGVLRIEAAGELALSREQGRFVDALAYYVALGVERVRLVADAERAESERRVEMMRSALLTAVSHDLRTPLTAIKAIAHEVAGGAPRDRARVIESEADRLDALVGDLLDLSRIHAGAVQPRLELNTIDDLLGSALQRVQGLAQGRELVVDVASGDVLVGRFDLTQSLRIVVNLLENALKYSPPNAPVAVTARRRGEALVLAVLDRGAGIPPAEGERIFEPFYRPLGTPPDVRGTGLGLSIARGLAEAQGGTLHYHARDGGGSVFTLQLQAADAPSPESSPATPS